MTEPKLENPLIIYGELEEDEPYLVALPAPRVEELVALNHALNKARTWGQLRKSIPEEEFQSLLEQTGNDLDDEDERPADDAPFALDTLPCYFDGDYPPWPAQEMSNRLPELIVKSFVKINESVLNGLYRTIHPSEEDEFVEAMLELGFACRRDDAMIRGISGHYDELRSKA